jgi:hypothetical protein
MTDTAPIPRVALTREEAAAALGMSLDSFERHVQPELRLIRRGKLRLIPVAELHRWADSAAERTSRERPVLPIPSTRVGRRRCNVPARGPRRQDRHEHEEPYRR